MFQKVKNKQNPFVFFPNVRIQIMAHEFLKDRKEIHGIFFN